MLKRFTLTTAALLAAATAVAAADDHPNDHRTVVHRTVERTVVRPTVVNRTVVVRAPVARGWAARSDFRSGGRIAQGDWQRGRVVDYRVRRLRAPPPGYEWRQVGGRYVMAAVATGVIASIIAASQ